MENVNLPKFLIIDGNAIMHRAYHALPPLTTREGEPIGAVYGFFSMLLKLFQDVKPAYLAVCFDRPKPTFRKQLFVGYQAKRPAMAEELSGQIKIVHEILEKANISIFEVDGFEADDVIGTLASQARSSEIHAKGEIRPPRGAADQRRLNPKPETRNDLEIIIVSGDRDMLQLVNPRVKILMPIVGITKMILYDEKQVWEKYGLNPSEIVDYKALAGDASDNYSGVPGVGPKTAITLIKKYGSLTDIYKNLGNIEKENSKLAKKLTENYDSASLARILAGIVKDVPLVFDISYCQFSLLDGKNLKKTFEKYSFKSLLKRFDEVFNEEKTAEKGKIPRGASGKFAANKKTNSKQNKSDSQLKLIG